MSTALAPALLLGLAVLLLLAPGPSRLRQVLREDAAAAGPRRRRPAAAESGGDGGAARGLGPAASSAAVAGWWSGRRPGTGRVAARGAAAAAGAVVLGAVLAGVVVLGPGGTAAVGLLLLGGSATARTRRRAAAAAQERAGALAACAVLAGELRAGRAPADALEAAAGPARGAFAARLRAAAAAVRLGGDPCGALAGSGAPTTCVPVLAAGLAACWRVCSRSGAGLAAAVERLEDGLRAADAARRAVEAELAGPRATAALLALLPLAGIGLAAALGARPLHVLLETGLGQVCLVLGVALDAAGLLWTRRLAAGADVRA